MSPTKSHQPPLPRARRNRREAVMQMVDAGVAGMTTAAHGTTSVEVMSAALTIAMRTVRAALQTDPALRAVAKEGCQILLMECADEDRPQ